MSDYIAERRKKIKEDINALDRIIDSNTRIFVINNRRKELYDILYKHHYNEKDLVDRRFLAIGPGSFRHKYWRTADKTYGEEKLSWMQRRGVEFIGKPDYHWDIMDGIPLNEEDNYFNVIYSSHVIEHFFDSDVLFMFKEVYRLLKPGGVFRVICPDIRLFAESYINKDWGFFLDYLYSKTGRISSNMLLLEELYSDGFFAKFLLSFVSLLANDRNDVFLSNAECKEFIESEKDMFYIFDKASELSSRELNKEIGAHVNWFDKNKLMYFLKRSGFKDVKEKSYLKSNCAILRDPNFFDKTDPEMSIFFEAYK